MSSRPWSSCMRVWVSSIASMSSWVPLSRRTRVPAIETSLRALGSVHSASPDVSGVLATAGAPNSTDASFWRIIFCPAGPGHVLYLKSELTEGRWRIYSDNIAMARWLQKTVQGMLNPELKDLAIPVADAAFDKSGDARDFWTEHVSATDAEVALTWHAIGE